MPPWLDRTALARRDGLRTPSGRWRRGIQTAAEASNQGAAPPGPLPAILRFGLEKRYGFPNGNAMLEVEVEVLRVTRAAPSRTHPEVERPPTGTSACEGAHEEGSARFRLGRRGQQREIRSAGRRQQPAFGEPLVCQSILPPLHELRGRGEEPPGNRRLVARVYDGRIHSPRSDRDRLTTRPRGPSRRQRPRKGKDVPNLRELP